MKPSLLTVWLLMAGPALAQTMPGMTMPPAAKPAPTWPAPTKPALAQPGLVAAPGAIPVAAPEISRVGKRVEYDLYVAAKPVNFTGKTRLAITINGQLPAPTLTFTEGDTAVVRVHNQLTTATSIHWHGLLLPNKEDGVPYLTTAPILAGGTHTFTFPLHQHGTYWYHSHDLQEQLGLYGALVILPKQPRPVLKEYVLLLSDWTDEQPGEVLRYLKRAGEWYAVQKGAIQSYGEALAAGYFKDKVKQEWGRMPAMDVSDVSYNKFLSNGQEKTYFKDAQPGEVVRVRVINGGTSSYFQLQYAGGQMQVVAADGQDVVTFITSKLEMATAETYDLLLTVPTTGAAELRATSSDVTGYTAAYFGTGAPLPAPDLPRLNYFQMMRDMNQMGGRNGMDMSGTGRPKKAKTSGPAPKDPAMKGMAMSNQKGAMPPTPSKRPLNRQQQTGMAMGRLTDQGAGADQSGMSGMDMGTSFSYNQLRAPHPTTLDSTHKWREIKLTLTGNMLRYIWSLDNKTLSVADAIPIRRGENVRMVFHNATMMRHPLHLHGHLFRLVNAQGAYSPLKHTFDIPAMGDATIEFDANAEQDWFFHCHTLYHMAAGMGRVISYEGSPPNEYAKTGYRMVKPMDNARYLWADFSVHSQAAFLEANLSNNKNALEFEGRVSYQGNYETETHLLRYLDKRQFLAAYVGYDLRDNKTLRSATDGEGGNRRTLQNNRNFRRQAEVGIYYLLPMLVRAELRTDLTGQLRLQLERRDLPLSNNVFADLRINSDREYLLGVRYMVSKYASLSTNYDNQYGWGAGLTLHY